MTREEVKIEIPRIAKEWLHTPFVMNACCKGKGVDCARFVAGVFKEAGLISKGYNPPPEHNDWVYGKDVNPDTFVNELLRFGDRISFEDREPGDVISFYWMGIESHLGIIIERVTHMIHSVRGKEVIMHPIRIFMPNFCSVYRIRV